MTKRLVKLLHRRTVSFRAGDRREDERCSRGKLKNDKIPFLFSKVCESLSRDLLLIHLLDDLNSYGIERGKCVEIVWTLHAKFFLSGSLLPNGPVAFNESGLKLKLR